MATALYSHNACLGHENHPGHPESPDRLKAILAELSKPEFETLIRREAPPASLDAIERVHDSAYIDAILSRVPKSGYAALDPDTGLSPLSGEAARRAAGSLIMAVDDVMKGEIENAFCAVRPPGHHAEHATVMGFCLFNNVAIGAAHAIAKHGLTRIAIVDFDVHHGNGTEEWAKGQKEILFISSHQFPLWPGSGRASDQGPLGNIVNVPLPPESDGDRFRHAMQHHALPKLDAYAPELIFISAGFDAHRADPLANLALSEEDFGWITGALKDLAQKHAKGRLISTLEGGYNLDALAKSAAAHVRALQKA